MEKVKKRILMYSYILICGITLGLSFGYLFAGRYLALWYTLLGLAALTFPRLLSSAFHVEMTTEIEIASVLIIFFSCIFGEAFGIYDYIPVWDDLMHLVSGFLFCAFGMSLWERHCRGQTLGGFCFAVTACVIWEFIEYFCDRVLHTDMQKDTLVTSVASHMLSAGAAVGYVANIVVTRLGGFTLAGHLDIGLYDTMNDLVVGAVGAVLFLILYRIDGCLHIRTASAFVPKYIK